MTRYEELLDELLKECDDPKDLLKYRKFKRPLPSYSDTQASARERTPVSKEASWRTDETSRRSGLRSKSPDLDR